MESKAVSKRNRETVVTMTDPPAAQALLNDTRWAWLWLVARLYLGWVWLTSGVGKLGDPAWTQSGAALQGFWERAVAIPAPPARPPIAYGWYRSFIEALLEGGHYTWFAKLIVAGELIIGVTLILGLFVGITAFFGGFLNWNFMMAGAASTNPVLFTLAILLMLAWKTAGWWGLDRWVLPLIGTPWRPGRVFRRRDESASRTP
jgi:thiosulfate dehydrogenase (quinone) large subunit